jgi:hypothetical protein
MEQIDMHRSSVGIMSLHHQIAKFYIFHEVFDYKIDTSELSLEKISRVGIVSFDKTTQTIRFVHKTFAEFFIAEYLLQQFKGADPISKDCINILLTVLTDEDHSMIRIFIDSALNNFKPENNIGWFFTEQSMVEDLLHCAAGEGLEALVDYLIVSMNDVNDETVRKILMSCNDWNENILMMAAKGGSIKIFNQIWNLVESCCNDEYNLLVTLCLTNCFNKINFLHYAIFSSRGSSHCEFIENIFVKLSFLNRRNLIKDNEVKELLTARDDVNEKSNLYNTLAEEFKNSEALKTNWKSFERSRQRRCYSNVSVCSEMCLS